MLREAIVVLCALCAAVFGAIGIVVRQRATLDVPADKGVSTMMLATLVRRRLWWAGTAAAVAGYGFQALALMNGSLLLVQPLLVSALLFALPMSARLAGRRVSRADWLWALLLTVALAVFVVVARPRAGEHTASIPASTVASVVCVPIVVACVVVAARSGGWRRAVLLAAAVGGLFGVVAVLTKTLMFVLDAGGVAGALATPTPYLLALFGVSSTLLQQSAFHAGALKISVPTMLVVEPVVAVLLGAIVLGEQVDASTTEAVLLTMAVLAMTAATVALGRDEGAYEEELEADIARRRAGGRPAPPVTELRGS